MTTILVFLLISSTLILLQCFNEHLVVLPLQLQHLFFLHSLKIKVKKCQSYDYKIVDLVLDRLIVGLRFLVADKLTDGKVVLLGHLIENDDDEIV